MGVEKDHADGVCHQDTLPKSRIHGNMASAIFKPPGIRHEGDLMAVNIKIRLHSHPAKRNPNLRNQLLSDIYGSDSLWSAQPFMAG